MRWRKGSVTVNVPKAACFVERQNESKIVSETEL